MTLATAWKQKLKDETLLKVVSAKAEGGDGEAMWLVGALYETGMKGRAKDRAQACAWYERSAAARDPRGMAAFGHYLLEGLGRPQDNVFGMMNVTEAAGLGSELGAYRLGWAFFEGELGLPKDPARARYWLKKVVDDECEYKHFNNKWMAKSAEMLRELDA